MKSRRLDVSENRLISSRSRCLKPSKPSSMNRRENLESIPMDLVMEILSRLPAKSIAKCRCLSKLWASMLCLPDFTELYLTRSRARPQLLFACHSEGELCFFSSPNPDENSSHVTASYHHMKIPSRFSYLKVRYINGLVFLIDYRLLKGRKKPAYVSVLCNPTTRQSSVLSRMKTRKTNGLFSFFGYDPVQKQFKVLSMTNSSYSSQEYQVMTLGTGKKSWRKIECCIPHRPTCNVICINGVLYYRARLHRARFPGGAMIVCFDIRSEKFSFMKVSDDIVRNNVLVNYNGKLGSLVPKGLCVTGSCTDFVLWILEDKEKNEWSKHVYVLPPMWKDVVGNIGLDFVGVIGANEFVFSPFTHSSSFYLFYFDVERNTVRRVEIHGLETSKVNRVFTFLNHVEDIKLIHGY